jgi:hypothetical protein
VAQAVENVNVRKHSPQVMLDNATYVFCVAAEKSARQCSLGAANQSIENKLFRQDEEEARMRQSEKLRDKA